MKIIKIPLILILICAGCANQPTAAELVVPTRIHTPTQTATAVPTATPTALVLTDHGGQTEPYPDLEVITAENVHRLEEVDVWGQGMVMGIALSPDASTIAVSTPTGIYFYDADTMEQIDWIDFFVEREDCFSKYCWFTYDNLDYSPDGKSLLVGFDDLYILDLKTKKRTRLETSETDKKPSYIMETTFSIDGSNILFTRATPSAFGHYMRFEIYDMSSEVSLFYYDFSNSDFEARIYQSENEKVIIGSIMVDSSSGNLLQEENNVISGAIDRVMTTERIADNQWQVTLPLKKRSCVFQEDFRYAFSWGMNDISEDGLKVLTLDKYPIARVNIWDMEQCLKAEQFVLFPDASNDIAFSPKGNYLISGAINSQDHYVWDVYSTKVIEAIQADWLEFDTYESELIRLVDKHSPVEDSCQSIVENIFTGKIFLELDGCWLNEFEMNPVNNNIILLENLLYDISKPNAPIKNYSEYPLHFTPDGKYVVYLIKQNNHPYAFLYFDSAMDGELAPSETRLIPIPSVLIMRNSWVNDFQVSPFGQYVMLFGYNEFLIWDLFNEKPIIINEKNENTYIQSLAFFSNDELLLIREDLSGNEKITIQDVLTNRLIYEFTTLQEFSKGPLISPDGKLLAFLANDGTIRIYGVKKGK